MNLELLHQSLPKSAIKHRKQGNISLSYIEGYHAINMANEIFGYGNWSKSVEKLECVHTEEREVRTKSRYDVFYIARVVILVRPDIDDETGCAFEDVGYGNGSSYSGYGEAHELAAKEAVTDAMKRALRHFGDQFGNCLYNKDFKPAEEPTKTPSTPSKPAKESALPDMTADQRKRMGRIWKFVDTNLNTDGTINPEDIAAATYATLMHWPDSAKDEETIINSIGIKK